MQVVTQATPQRPGLSNVQSPWPTTTASYAIALLCPMCRGSLAAGEYHDLGLECLPICCSHCNFSFRQRSGIWQALPEARRAYYARFLREYEAVRKAEGRGSAEAEYYLSLPDCDRTSNNSWQWAIRARSFHYLIRKILPALSREVQPMLILDLGAGNGWLSHRLAKLGDLPVAIDLQTNTFDGLGAASHYWRQLPFRFPRFQAELDRLPFADGQFDCAIFNASFHYSENYDVTLAEAIRCLRPGGTLVVADSPFYRREESGRRMLQERRESFQRQFGFVSDGLASQEYLTSERLLALEARHDIEWRIHNVWYGIRWAWRPLAARLKGRREPSQFRIYTAQVKT